MLLYMYTYISTQLCIHTCMRTYVHMHVYSETERALFLAASSGKDQVQGIEDLDVSKGAKGREDTQGWSRRSLGRKLRKAPLYD